MRLHKTALRIATLVSFGAALSFGCTDVGDSSSGTGPSDAGDSQDSTNAIDAQSADDGSGDDSTVEGGATTGPQGDTGAAPDDEAGLDEPDDTGPPDASLENTEETGAPEAGGGDGESPEAGAADGGSHESGDGGEVDSGPQDAGAVEAGPHDAGQDATVIEDSGTPDTGAGDAGTGGGHDAGGHDAGALVPCTTAGQAGCVQCTNSANPPICTATEALIVENDIAKGNLTAAGQLKANTATDEGSCYTCLNAKACLDDNAQDTGNECADTPDLTGGAPGSGVTQCLATIACILQSDCQGAGGIAGTSAVASQENVQLCYCGGNNAGSVCSTAGAGTNGICVTQEAAGFGFPYADNKDILANYGSQVYPSGSANALFQCAASNHCKICE